MEIDEAAALIREAIATNGELQVWADLGCGSGTFTRALASLLPAGSTVHAIDRQSQIIPRQYRNAIIKFRQADFENDDLHIENLDGILLANSLHYVQDQKAVITKLAKILKPEGRCLLVEYDHRKANRWVPYPIPFEDASKLLRSVGFKQVKKSGERPSAFGQATMYSCVGY
jgi:ubiquinone/menaquinone biosynthesis C-methylase UbiE